MSESKKVNSWKSVLNTINEENIDRFMEDLSMSLKKYLSLVKVLREEPILNTKNKSNTELLLFEYEWTDDGNIGVIETKIIAVPDEYPYTKRND